MRPTIYVLLVGLVAACRMGGPGGSAVALQETLEDSGPEAGQEPDSFAPGPSPARDDGAAEPVSTPALDAGDTDPSQEAGVVVDAGTPPSADGGTPVSFGNACRPAFTGCDAIQNTDCPPLMQCIVDSASAGAVGSCAFSNIPVDAGLACAQNPLGTSCPAGHGCVDDMCLRYCTCDDECGAGSTCTVEVAAGSLSDVKACSP